MKKINKDLMKFTDTRYRYLEVKFENREDDKKYRIMHRNAVKRKLGDRKVLYIDNSEDKVRHFSKVVLSKEKYPLIIEN